MYAFIYLLYILFLNLLSDKTGRKDSLVACHDQSSLPTSVVPGNINPDFQDPNQENNDVRLSKQLKPSAKPPVSNQPHFPSLDQLQGSCSGPSNSSASHESRVSVKTAQSSDALQKSGGTTLSTYGMFVYA